MDVQVHQVRRRSYIALCCPYTREKAARRRRGIRSVALAQAAQRPVQRPEACERTKTDYHITPPRSTSYAAPGVCEFCDKRRREAGEVCADTASERLAAPCERAIIDRAFKKFSGGSLHKPSNRSGVVVASRPVTLTTDLA